MFFYTQQQTVGREVLDGEWVGQPTLFFGEFVEKRFEVNTPPPEL